MQGRCFLDRRTYLIIRPIQAFGQRLGYVLGWKIRLEGFVEGRNHHVAGYIARRMASHAIGHYHQRAGFTGFGVTQLADHVSVFLIVPRTINLIACYFEFNTH